MQKNALCDLNAMSFSVGPIMGGTLGIHDPAKPIKHAITIVFTFCGCASKRRFPAGMRKTIVKAMKLTAFFMLVLGLHLSARTSSQTVSLSGKGLSLKKVISVVEKQTGLLVFANEELLNLARPVTITAHDMPLKDFLDITFRDQPLKYVIEGISILISRKPVEVSATKPLPRQTNTSGFAEAVPQRSVTGTVKDSTGSPLAGATITLKGKKTSVTSDASGKFEIQANEGDVLIISYVGFQSREVTIRNTNDLHVMLRASQMGMDEVVMVGYGTQKKATVTGSIASVKGTEIAKAPTTNLTSALAGRMTGVIINSRGSNPGGESMNIFIRGKSSWQGGGPLIIIDGIANRSGWERINPDEIESVSVLKDASAAIFGSRAANGVILITTKRGKSGRPVLEYHGDYGLTQVTRIPEMTRSWQYAQYYTEAKRSGYIYTPEEIEKFRTGADANLFPNYDLNDYAVGATAPQTTHTISLHGGNDAVKYFISGRYLYQGAVYKNAVDDFKSYNIRSNIDVRASKNLNFSLNLSGRRDDRNRAVGSDASNGFFEELLGTDPTKPIFYSNGLPAAIYGNNLVEMIKGNAGTNNDNTTTINSQFTAKWDLPFITQGLYLEGTGAYDFSNVRTKQFSQSYDLYSYGNATNEYSNLNTNPVLNRGLYDYYYNSYRYTLNARIGYNRNFGLHNLSAFAAYEQYSTNNEWISASRSTFLSNQIPYLFMGAADGQKNDGSGYEYAYRNLFGRVAYAYNNKYLLDFTLRRDESLKFAPSNRTGLFPGISAGWRISEENFVKNNYKAIDNLKLRASWGQMGSDNVADYQYLASAALRASSSSMVLGAAPAVVSTLYLTGTANPDISWEVANTYNVALEGSLWKGLLGFEVEYFYSKRTNILATRNASVPNYTGLVLPAENIGKAQNKGVEILLTHRNNIGQLKYDIGLNVTYTANKILYMDESANVPDYQRREVHPIDSWLVYKTNGIFNNQAEFDKTPVKRAGAQLGDIIYEDVDGDNAITDKDKVRMYASSLPRYTFGIPMNFELKGFDLNMLWQGQTSAKTYVNPTERNGDINVPLWLYNDRWTAATAESATLPRAFFHRSETYNTIASDFWLKDASFLRLKSLQFGYSLPQHMITKLSMSAVRFYVSGFNLLLFDKIKDYDPEVVNNLGVFYPSTKVYNLGVRVTF